MNEAQEAYIKMISMFDDPNPTEFTNEILIHNYAIGGLYLLGALIAGICTYICLVHFKDRYESRALSGFWFLVTLTALFFGISTISDTYLYPRLVILEHLSTME